MNKHKQKIIIIVVLIATSLQHNATQTFGMNHENSQKMKKTYALFLFCWRPNAFLHMYRFMKMIV